MRTAFFAALVFAAAAVPMGSTVGQTPNLEQKIWTLLDNDKAPYVALSEPDFRALGAGFDLPDGGRAVTELAEKAPGGAFDPRDLSKISPQQLGYRADWVVERFRRYNLDWDIGALRLTSLNPDAKNYPWFIIMNGGAANFYEFYVDLKNRPGWTQFLAQKLNVMIVTIPGNFKYGGWDAPISDVQRQPAYLLDRELPMQEYEIRNAIYTNSLILQGVKQLVMKNTTGDILLIGHSTSGEIAMLAYEDNEMGPRLKGRYPRLGQRRSGAARIDAHGARQRCSRSRRRIAPVGKRSPLQILERRDPPSYSRGYSGFSESTLRGRHVASCRSRKRWLATEGRRRPNFKQQLQNLEHGTDLGQKAVGRERDRDAAQDQRQSVGNCGRGRRQGSLRHQLHASGRLQAHGVDDRAFRPQPLESGRPDEERRGLRRQRIPHEESDGRHPLINLGSADDALRPSRAAATARGGALQRGALAR